MSKPRGLIPISMATLLPSAMLGIEVYVRAAGGLPPTKLFDSDQPVDCYKLDQYMSAGVKSAFIFAEDRAQYQAYLQANWQSILEDESAPITNRLCIMGEVVRDVMTKQFRADETTDLIGASNQIAQTAVELISNNDIALEQLSDVLHHDYGTFTHSTNVSLYCVLLAKQLGFSTAEQQEMAVGALLHDLGKLEIDSAILNKPGPLNLQEMRTMKLHPVTAFHRLSDRPDVTFGQLMMAYQHHERLNGSGYPCGIPSDDIHPYAKICAIVDVFEALTSERPYRKPMELSDAMGLIGKGRGTEFASDMVDAWQEVVEKGRVSCV